MTHIQCFPWVPTANINGPLLELLSTVCRDSVATLAIFATVDTLFLPVDTIPRQKWSEILEESTKTWSLCNLLENGPILIL